MTNGNTPPAPLTDDDFEMPEGVDMSNPLISGADPSKGKIYDKLRLSGGVYWGQIEEIATVKHQQFGHMVRVTCKVIHVVEAQEFISKSEPPQPCSTLKVGQSPTRMIRENQYGHGAQEINSLLSACGVPDKDIVPRTVALYCSAKSPAIGKVVEVVAETTLSSNGRRFDRVTWRRSVSNDEIVMTLSEDQLRLAGLVDLIDQVEGD